MKHILTLAALVIATSCFGQEACPNMYDGNGNGTIDIEDFLGILGLFGDVDIDSDGLWDSQDGCTDLAACNYDLPFAVHCNYPDALGDCFGDCPLDENGDGICDVYACSTPVLFQGIMYSTVQVGNQCWFAENLRSELYLNGDSISTGYWEDAESGRVAVYGEGWYGCSSHAPNGDACDEIWALEAYGRTYNGHAVNDERGLCPYGWHIPTNAEWNSVGAWVAGDGNKLKSITGWHEGGNGNNETGFNAFPGGTRYSDGTWVSGGVGGYWWSSSTANNGQSNFFRGLNTGSSIQLDTNGNRAGLSVRCIKDSE